MDLGVLVLYINQLNVMETHVMLLKKNVNDLYKSLEVNHVATARNST